MLVIIDNDKKVKLRNKEKKMKKQVKINVTFCRNSSHLCASLDYLRRSSTTFCG